MKKPSRSKPQPHDKNARELQKMTFSGYLQQLFGKTSADNVLEVFDRLGLPAPRSGKEFLAGAEGGLVFLNQYGLVIRIEHSDPENGRFGWSRVDDSGWVLRPLAGIEAGHAHVEICPGCNLEQDARKIDYLKKRLEEQRIDFWDRWLVNIGRVPVCTERFPEGMPVVIDRLAVCALTESAEPVAKALAQEAQDAAEVQETLYAPLRAALDEAWPDKEGPADAKKMQTFWKLCAQYVADGKMVAGWNQAEIGVYYKTDIVINVAKTYGARLMYKAHKLIGETPPATLGSRFGEKAQPEEQDNMPSGGHMASKHGDGGKRPKP